ncbi:T3SS (YopN, CesT) and YbjN peptide-binding chaperone 1 [Paenibacillus ferrarius]|uniref:T3SS (YopN, CesT) and YbjN peptide-binding chaperone 1 n=1 Tax=Paenibacillus ferrarius TaxID=1469647 RepID=UPI003D2A7EE0
MHPTIERNINLFRNYINEIDFVLDEENGRDGTPFFAMNIRTDSGANIRLVAAFTLDYPSVDIYCFNLADITNPLKREIALKHINDLNINYRYSKFTINDEGAVTISAALDFNESFDPSLIVRHIRLLYKAADDEYRNFMKIAWS